MTLMMAMTTVNPAVDGEDFMPLLKDVTEMTGCLFEARLLPNGSDYRVQLSGCKERMLLLLMLLGHEAPEPLSPELAERLEAVDAQ